MKPLLIPLLALALAACEPSPPPASDAQATADPAPAAPVRWVDASADAALREQRSQWKQALEALLASPDVAHLEKARQHWRALYQSFNQHYIQLAARACASQRTDRLERLDRWPFFPAYVDALPAWPDSGMVNDPTLPLTAQTVRQQQGATDDGEVALGFQPLWLMIAGVPTAPRQPADLQAGPERNGERRRQYLTLTAAQLENDLGVLGTDVVLSSSDLHCALTALDQRLARLAAYRQASDAEDGLYLPAHTSELIDATQPGAALAQLSAADNRALSAELERAYPGFQTALDQARRNQSWAPIAHWLAPAHP